MMLLLLNDRELRLVARLLHEGEINDKEACATLLKKVDAVIDANLDALLRIDAHESGGQ